MAFLELVTLLPPGAPSQTRLARHGHRLVVLRELREGTACFYPEATPHLVTVEEVGELQGKRHALFPYVPGVTLRDLVDAFAALKKPMPLGLAGGVVLAAARALAAHQPARAHGGLHDAALQVAFTGETFVLDFGAPRATRFRALGRDSLAADVFALGGVLHAALTGYQGPYVNPPAGLPRPSLSHPEATPGLDDVVLRALSPQVPGRQADVATFARELAAVLPVPWEPADLHALINSLFQERVRLLQSLSGLTEPEPGPALGEEDVDLATAAHRAPPSGPLPPIPMGTEPGGVGDGTSPGVRLPWLVDDAVEADEPVEDGGTLPRAEVPQGREELTSPGAPAPEGRPSRPPQPSAGNLRAMSDETDAGQRAPRPSAANLRAMSDETEAGQRAPRPSAGNLRAMSDETEAGPRVPRASAPGPRSGADAAEVDQRARASAPRASVAAPRALPDEPRPSRAEAPDDTDPRRLFSGAEAASQAEDTAPRARAPAPPEDTAPRAAAPDFDLHAPRNTTTHERLRAAGQERVATPPTGTPAVGLGEEVESQPTAVRPRVAAVDEQVHADTMQKLPVVSAPKRGGRGLIAVLLVVIAGLGAAWAMKEGQLPAPEPLATWLGLAPDAGAASPEPSTDAGVSLALDAGLAEDAGTPDGADGGAGAAGDAGQAFAVPLDLDAGLQDGGSAQAGDVTDGGFGDAGVGVTFDGGLGAGVDAGHADAGTTEKPKAPPKKKKRRR